MKTRKDRRRAKVEHEKRVREHGMNVTNFVTQENHVSLFDEVHSKMSGDTPIKCQGIYDSVFCKG